MAKTQILDYYIHLTDKAQVESLQAQVDAGGGPDVGALLFIPWTGKFAILRAPLGAAAEFSAPLQEENVAFSPPCLRSPWFVPGANNFPRNVATFTRKSGGWFGIPFLFPQTTKFYWAGHFVYSPTTGVDGSGAAVTDAAPISKRRYVDGHEFLFAGDGQDNNSSVLRGTPDAQRHLGGFIGFSQHEASTGGWDSEHETNAQDETLGTQFTHWDRFKVRPRRYGTHESQFWAGNVNFIGRGFRLHMTAGGQVALYVNASGLLDGDKSLLGVGGSPMPLHQWHAIDVLMSAKDNLTCFIEVYLNKALIISGSSAISNDGDFIRGNFVGKLATEVTAAGAEIEVDDWVGCECPKNMDTYNPVWSNVTAYSIGDIVNFDPATPGSFAPRTFSQVRGKAYRAKTANTNKQPDTNPSDWARLNDAVDWLSGWRVVRIHALGDGADRANWTGNFRHANQWPPAGQGIGAVDLTTSVDGAILALTTDALDAAVRRPGVIGIGGICASMFGAKSAVPLNDCALGAKINGANVTSVITFALAGITQYQSNQINPHTPGATTPFQLTSFELRLVGGTMGGGSFTAQYLMASIELIGTFGPEDMVPGTSPEPSFPSFHAGIHNRWTPFSPWALATSRAFAPVVVHMGTYVGNGTAQDLTFRCPVHFLWIRQVAATAGMTKWWPSMVNAHLDDDDAVFRGLVTGCFPDPTFVPAGGEDDQAQRYIVRIGGTNGGINQNAVTYQYIAVQDPGARFLLTGAFVTDDQGSGFPRSIALAEPNWTPEAGFVWTEQEGAGTSGQSGFKGIGLGANEAIELPATQRTSYMGFLSGLLSVFNGASGLVSTTFDNYAYALFRRNDGAVNTGAFVLISWIGDGTASRTISWPAQGKRPVWAYAAGSGGSAFVRDPSHATTNSTNMATGIQGTTGITGGGIDSISVGSLLNANGIVYTALIFLGDATACNNGWGCNGEYIPDEPDYITDPNWDEPTEITPTTPTTPLSPDPDFDTSTTPGTTACGPTGPLGQSTINYGGWTGGQPCEFYTRRLLNMALQRIGQSKRIANASTDQTEEAFVAREFVLEDVNQCLRDFPWPFATRYANLVLVGGTADTPVNNDWQFSYRAPSCMIFARRMAIAGDFRGFRRHPIPFRRGSDDAGELIFCNIEATAELPLVLEFTSRLTCPAWFGDAMFRNALTWRFAASFAAALAKDSTKQAECLTQYEVVLKSAQTDASNEQQVQRHVEGEADWILDRDGMGSDWLNDRN